MKPILNRPDPIVAPGSGLLLKDHFQVAYVTNNLDRACDTFNKRYGIRNFQSVDGSMPSGGTIKVAFAWAGSLLYEIIDARGPGTDFYNELLPADEFAMQFHHLGFLIHNRESWQTLEQEFSATGWPIAYKSLAGNFMDAYYIKAPELGHYLEYIYPHQAGINFLATVPVN